MRHSEVFCDFVLWELYVVERGVSAFCPVNKRVGKAACTLSPHVFLVFIICLNHSLDKDVDHSLCGVSLFLESLEFPVMALEALHEEASLLGV